MTESLPQPAVATISIILDQKRRARLQPFMDKTGAKKVSDFLLAALNHDFSSHGLQSLFANSKWKVRDTDFEDKTCMSAITFEGGVAGLIKAQCKFRQDPFWVDKIVEGYTSYLGRCPNARPTRYKQVPASPGRLYGFGFRRLFP